MNPVKSSVRKLEGPAAMQTIACAEAATSAQCLQLLGSLGDVGFIRWQATRPELHLSTTARSTLRLAATEAVSLPRLLRAIDPQAWKQFKPVWRNTLRARQPSLEAELVLKPVGGPRVPVRIAASLHYTQGGQLDEIIVAVQDNSRQSEAVKALSESQERLSEAQEIARLAYWEWDFTTKRAEFSAGALAMLRRDENWVADWEEMQKLPPEDQRDWVFGLFSDAYAQKLPTLRYEVRYHEPDGSVRHLHTVAKIQYNALGRVTRLVATVQDVSELRSYRRQVHSLSFFDPLTNLPNRALFVERLREACTDASWQEQQLGLLMLDLDRFKDINDSFGHPAGDALLRQVAERLHQMLRGYDTVGRLGGDEFAIVLPEVRHPADMDSIAQKVLNAFAAPFTVQGKEVFVSASIGGALYPSNAKDVDQLMQFADAAMYHAKEQGRNNFQFYSPELTDKALERLSVEGELRKGLERSELELYYQPKFQLASGRLVGAEALMRWNHPTRGLVPPNEFIPVAEETGLIVPMGDWAFREACRQAVEWNAQSRRPLKVAVNLSARQLSGGQFLESVRRALQETNCDPCWMELEITESLLLDGHDDVQSMLREIEKMGITIAIDDFGIGYSALSYLTRFPIHILKIDRAFVKQVPGDRSSAELVKAIVSLGRSLNMELVAEGVETPEQAAYLNGLGCQIVQGYLFGKPMPHEEFTLFAKNSMALT